MLRESPVLLALVALVDRIPALPAAPRGRGRPAVYPDRLFLKAVGRRPVRSAPAPCSAACTTRTSAPPDGALRFSPQHRLLRPPTPRLPQSSCRAPFMSEG